MTTSSPAIPTYQLSVLQAPAPQLPGAYFLGPRTPAPRVAINAPYRSNYYKVGICLRGLAELKVNLETYRLEPGCLLLLSPYVVKQWVSLPTDFESRSIFFTREFMAAGSSLSLDKFAFYGRDAAPVVPLPTGPAARIGSLLELLERQYDSPHAYHHEVLQHLITGLLYEAAAVYETHATATAPLHTRRQLITAEFRRLLHEFGPTERSLGFYADKLCLSPKHLAETVKQATGKRAAEWLTETVVLEARVLLHDPALSVAQVADRLQFTDQSAFGRYFKKHTGYSPAAYRAAS